MVKYYYLLKHCFDGRGLGVSSDFVTVFTGTLMSPSDFLFFIYQQASMGASPYITQKWGRYETPALGSAQLQLHAPIYKILN